MAGHVRLAGADVPDRAEQPRASQHPAAGHPGEDAQPDERDDAVPVHGVLAVGATVAGLIGEYAGVRTALWVAALGVAFSWLPIAFSPLRRVRDLTAS